MMLEGWKTYKLGEIGSFFGGVTSIGKEDYGHGTPFLPYKNVYKNSKVDINDLELMNVSAKDIEKRSCLLGDVFFTASSETPDEVAMSSVLLDTVPKLTFNGFCKRFRINDFNTLSPNFARYLFRDKPFRRDIYQLATGDIRFNISQESLASIEITIPNLLTQSRIATILSSLDDKIELNLQMNKTLEAMAQAIFKEWFVDFRFPGFDGELIDGLPKGWSEGILGDIMSFQNGKTSPKRDDTGNFPVYGANGIIGFSNKTNAEEKVTVVGRVGSFCGSTYFAQTKSWVTDNAIIASPKINSYCFTYIKLHCLRLNSFKVGSGQPLINQTILSGIKTIIPDKVTLGLFEETILPIFRKAETNKMQNVILIQLRDRLMPKLLNGKIRVA